MSPRIALWAGVASLWIIVTLLKLQLQMFSANLFINVLGPTAAASQPPWLYALLSFVDRLWVQHLALANLTVFAVEAIKRRTALAWPRLAGGTHRPLALIAWGAVVWAVGEAFGSLLSGDARVMSEASGVSLVYVITGIVPLLPALDGSMAEPRGGCASDSGHSGCLVRSCRCSRTSGPARDSRAYSAM